MHKLTPCLSALAIAIGLAASACQREDAAKGVPGVEYARGWEKFREGEYDASVEAFRSASSDAPAGDSLRAAALYGEATVYNLRRPGNESARARDLYQQVIDAAPGSDLAACSLLDLANMLYPAPDVEPDWDALARAYQSVVDRSPRSPAGEEAFVARQFVVLRGFDPATTRDAVARLEKFAAERPDSPFGYSALMLASAGYETLGQWREVVNVRVRAAR